MSKNGLPQGNACFACVPLQGPASFFAEVRPAFNYRRIHGMSARGSFPSETETLLFLKVKHGFNHFIFRVKLLSLACTDQLAPSSHVSCLASFHFQA